MHEGRTKGPRNHALHASRSSSPVVRFHSPCSYEEEVRPKAVLTTLTLLGVIYTASISGGYGLEDSVSAGGPLMSIIFLCLIPLFWGIPVSLCVAELSCAIPSNAGPIMWVNCTFPSWFTYTVILWTAFLNSVDNSMYPTVFADYCATLFNLTWLEKSAMKIGFLLICTAVNILGVMIVGAFSVGIMIITLLPFLLIFFLQLPHGLDWDRISYVPPHINWAIFMPVIAWNFSGFDSAGNVIEEVQNPNPTFVRALILMIGAALATYIPPIIAGVSVQALKDVPFEDWSDGYWLKVGEAIGGAPIGIAVLIGGGISTLGLMVTLMATTSRSLAGMGMLNAFPRFISKWLKMYSPRFKTPVCAILVNFVITCVLSIFLNFHILVQLDQVLYSLRLIAILSTFLKLRLKQPLLERPYKAPGGTVAAFFWSGVPIIFSLFLIITCMTGGFTILGLTFGLIIGTILISIGTVHYFRRDGFEGSLVEEYEDAETQTYGAILERESEEWRKLHPTNIFIEFPPRIAIKSGAN